jgi:hypothetical protein
VFLSQFWPPCLGVAGEDAGSWSCSGIILVDISPFYAGEYTNHLVFFIDYFDQMPVVSYHWFGVWNFVHVKSNSFNLLNWFDHCKKVSTEYYWFQKIYLEGEIGSMDGISQAYIPWRGNWFDGWDFSGLLFVVSHVVNAFSKFRAFCMIL